MTSILITSGTSGVGLSIAKAFARMPNVNLMLHCLPGDPGSGAAAFAAQKEVQQVMSSMGPARGNGKVMLTERGLLAAADVVGTVDHAAATFGRLDIVINAAFVCHVGSLTPSEYSQAPVQFNKQSIADAAPCSDLFASSPTTSSSSEATSKNAAHESTQASVRARWVRGSRYANGRVVTSTAAAPPPLYPWQWDHMMSQNVTAAMHLTRAAIAPMRQHQFGRVIHLAWGVHTNSNASALTGSASPVDFSTVDFDCALDAPSSGAEKSDNSSNENSNGNVRPKPELDEALHLSGFLSTQHALCGVAQSFASDVAASGITVNCLAPSYVDTPQFNARVEALGGPAAAKAYFARRALSGAVTTGDEVAGACMYLALPSSKNTTGAVIPLDGGAGLL